MLKLVRERLERVCERLELFLERRPELVDDGGQDESGRFSRNGTISRGLRCKTVVSERFIDGLLFGQSWTMLDCKRLVIFVYGVYDIQGRSV